MLNRDVMNCLRRVPRGFHAGAQCGRFSRPPGVPGTGAAVETVPWNLIRLRPAEGGGDDRQASIPDALTERRPATGGVFSCDVIRPFRCIAHPVLEGEP